MSELPPRIAEIAYRNDTGSLFAPWAGRSWAVFLNSGGRQGERARYDIFAADPYITIVTKGDRTEIRTRASAEITPLDPFEVLKRVLCNGPGCVSQLPFTGGAIGYFAYDLGRRIERLPSTAVVDLDLPEMAMGVYDWAVIVDHQERRAYLVGQGRDERTFDEWERLRDRVEQPGLETGGGFMVHAPLHANLSRAEYGAAFRRIKRYIRAGDCYQVNFAQRFSARVEGDPWSAYRALQSMNPAPFAAFLNLPDVAVLSSSPERFLCVRDRRVETRPIKGTRARSPDPVRDRELARELRESPKDRAENLMIVDLLRNDLGKNCAIGSVQVPSLFEVESYATVQHLVSTVTGRLADGRHALDLMRGCFPGGSITGAPKLRAMEIIEELEPHRRGLYCGAIGYIGFNGDMDSSIAIRTLVLQRGWLHGWAGGGIVHDSEEDAEYQETLDKAEAMLRLLSCTPVSRVGA